MYEKGWELLYFKESALLFSEHSGIQIPDDMPSPFQNSKDNIARTDQIELVHPISKQPYPFELMEYEHEGQMVRYAIAEVLEAGLPYKCVWWKKEPIEEDRNKENPSQVIELEHQFGIYHSVPGMKEFLAKYKGMAFIEIWQEYHEFLKEKFGELLVPLVPGNAEKEITAIFDLYEAERIEDFVSLYRYCNGNDLEPWMELMEAGQPAYAHITGYPLMSLKEILMEAEDAVKDAGRQEEVQSIPEGFVKDNFMLSWKVPIYRDGGGHFIAIDLDPGTEGRYGQVIEVDYKYDDRVVLADSLKEYITVLYYFVKELGVIYNGEGFEGDKPISAYIVRS
ncbi:SMI1/KNR4 family protein [Planococcus shenhongbingii]|uniref:SMI1/KNR4 family protein n=1 Tax=Planococcus shenhongbingii TaxID=3058398 RepID=A0ABT8NF16_9BACL|nr:SMI1/KNR4 family protein [Planococcus sp. N017]MDN7246490.1 SMI1/KNR4 family protein [Planococcus sp. N017]